MNESDYLNIAVQDNMALIEKHIESGYLNWQMLEASMEDRLVLVNRVFPQTMAKDPLRVLGDFENCYVAALRVIGDKSESLFKQLNDIRSGDIWKKL